MTESQKIELRRSKVRGRLAEIAKLAGDGYSDTIQTEERELQDEYVTLEQRGRTALVTEDAELEQRRSEAGNGLDPEHRERAELRSKAKLSNYFDAAEHGRVPVGVELARPTGNNANSG